MDIQYIEKWIFNSEKYGQFSCLLPASAYSVLYENGKIGHPHRGKSFDEPIQVAETDCCFCSAFVISKGQLRSRILQLCLSGLDTVCDIEINGNIVLHTENLFRSYAIDLKGFVKEGENSLKIYIRSPLAYVRAKQAKRYVWAQTDEVNGTSITLDGIAHIQKPSYMFGWDWAPQLPDMGIYGKVFVRSGENRISDAEVRCRLFEGSAELSVCCTSEYDGAQFLIKLFSPQGELLEERKCAGKEKFEIDAPQLWWPNGLGAQPLYKLNICLLEDGGVADSVEKNIGIRSLTVSREKDSYGKEFCFVVNGKKIFAMGANFVPYASPAVWMTDERLQSIIADCAEANFNCIRVWGGGFYGSDLFYDLCDRFGLIVWQDFMFACRNIDMSSAFIENVAEEVKENILRIRHHASLGLLCGNNEMEECVFGNPQLVGTPRVVQDYLAFYEHMLSDMTEKYAPDVFYWPSSPSAGGSGRGIWDENDGDSHFWETWHAGKPFEVYRQHYFRFCSEYGFESFPSVKTLADFCKKEELNAFSNTMMQHQRCRGGNEKIVSNIADKFIYPEKFEDLVYASQIIQGEAIKYGVEHFRRNRHRCKGSIYWQLNDCWPAISWSSIDYFGRWKALHYMAKRFYAPVLLSACESKEKIVFTLSNEQTSRFEGDAEFFVADSSFCIRREYRMHVSAAPFTANDIYEFSAQDIDAENEFVGFRLLKDGVRLCDEAVLLTVPKKFRFRQPKISFSVLSDDKGYLLKLRAEKFTKYVFLECDKFDIKFSDNYFSMTDAQTKEIRILSDHEIARGDIEKNIRIKTVSDLI